MSSSAAKLALRNLTKADFGNLLRLNQASLPHVNSLEMDRLESILDMATYARGVFHGEEMAGALIALPPGEPYNSDNYRWFNKTKKDRQFMYVDRIMVDTTKHQGGVGRALYTDLGEFAREGGFTSLAAEVNSEPPNPVSMAFHKKLGFEEIGEHKYGESKSVVFLTKPLEP